jgi:hypothetical protein
MTSNLTRKALLGTATAAVVGATIMGSANAAVRFINVADRPVIFTMRCEDSDQTYRWRVRVDHSLDVTCNNGAARALVRLYTDDEDTTHVVSRVVFDGLSYDLGFNNDGDASIRRSA